MCPAETACKGNLLLTSLRQPSVSPSNHCYILHKHHCLGYKKGLLKVSSHRSSRNDERTGIQEDIRTGNLQLCSHTDAGARRTRRHPQELPCGRPCTAQAVGELLCWCPAVRLGPIRQPPKAGAHSWDIALAASSAGKLPDKLRNTLEKPDKVKLTASAQLYVCRSRRNIAVTWQLLPASGRLFGA